MPQDVANLVTAARDGDRAAFDELVRATYAETFTLALRLTGNEEDARDVVQEAYIRAFRGLGRFRGDAQFSTWMYRITANCANTHLVKRTKHRHEVLDDANPVADDHPPPIRSSRPTPPPSGTGSRTRWSTCRPSSARWWCCGTSTTCPTRRSRPSSGSPRPRPRSASTGRARSCGRTCSPAVWRRPPMRCEELSEGLAAAADGSVLLGRNERRHVERCLRCQAELVQYRKVLRAMRAMRTEVLEPAPGLLADVLANLEAAGERRAIRSMIQGHRAAYLGGLAAATAAGAAGAIVYANRGPPRPHRQLSRASLRALRAPAVRPGPVRTSAGPRPSAGRGRWTWGSRPRSTRSPPTWLRTATGLGRADRGDRADRRRHRREQRGVPGPPHRRRVPATVVVKLPALDEAAVFTSTMLRMYTREAGFFERARPPGARCGSRPATTRRSTTRRASSCS